jgi:hypothetical protein
MLCTHRPLFTDGIISQITLTNTAEIPAPSRTMIGSESLRVHLYFTYFTYYTKSTYMNMVLILLTGSTWQAWYEVRRGNTCNWHCLSANHWQLFLVPAICKCSAVPVRHWPVKNSWIRGAVLWQAENSECHALVCLSCRGTLRCPLWWLCPVAWNGCQLVNISRENGLKICQPRRLRRRLI